MIEDREPLKSGDVIDRMKTGAGSSRITDAQLNEAICRLGLALQKFLDNPSPLQGESRAYADEIAGRLHKLLTEREMRKQKRRLLQSE